MILNIIRPKNETEDLLISITKKCETLMTQTHRKAQETLEFKPTTSGKTFSFKLPFSIEGSWMIGLTSLDILISIRFMNKDYNKFEHYTPKSDEFSLGKSKNELEDILKVSDISLKNPRDDRIAARIFNACTE